MRFLFSVLKILTQIHNINFYQHNRAQYDRGQQLANKHGLHFFNANSHTSPLHYNVFDA